MLSASETMSTVTTILHIKLMTNMQSQNRKPPFNNHSHQTQIRLTNTVENKKYKLTHTHLFGRVRKKMVEYVRGTPPDRWHWCKNCSQYPLYAYQKRSTRPDSDLCDECNAKETKQVCTL